MATTVSPQSMEAVNQATTLDSAEFSVTSANSHHDGIKSQRLANLKQNLNHRRASLTPMEFSYLNSLLVEKEGDDLCHEKMEILEENLNDSTVFFDPKDVRKAENANEDLGSARRTTKLEQRRSASRALWKQATLNIMACNRLMKMGDSGGGSKFSKLIQAIQEGGSSDEDDDSVKDNVDEEKKTSEGEPNTRRELVTRRASQDEYDGEGFEIGEESVFKMYAKHYDPWEDTTNAEGNPFEFHIIGTSADDVDSHPHVLSPPQMQSLQEHLPFSKRGESFWLKYSLVRDGACKASFLQHLRGEQYTVLAMETLDGEIFGAFTASPWNIQHGYFGTAESFVWRIKHPREDDDDSDELSYAERARRERDMEAFRFTFENNVAQICSHDRIAIGGGTVSHSRMVADGSLIEPNEFGFAISFDGSNLLEATTSPSITFNSPSLSKEHHDDGSKFELLNLEVWALTPCISVEEAHQMACQKLFLKRNMTV